MFPSPYGVSFILMNDGHKEGIYMNKEISVSLQSIVHSYVPEDSLQKTKSILFSFRLLTEYHSFL